MDTKQLYVKEVKEGIYPIVQDTVTVIELNWAVTELTNDSSSADIQLAFDSATAFDQLVENLRDIENIFSGITINDNTRKGKLMCTCYANATDNIVTIEYVFDGKFVKLVVTHDTTFSCVRTEKTI